MAKNFKTLTTNKGNIRVKRYGFGWAVFSGQWQSLGSYSKIKDLEAAINQA